MRKKVTNKTKKILGAFAIAGMLAMSVNSVQAAQEEYTAGSSMGKEYDELEQAYSDDEVLATASNQGHWEVNYAGWWYQYSDGTYPRSSWVNISNKWYYFDENGYMVTGSRNINNAWYYFDGSGEMLTGWQYYLGAWWYHKPSGAWVQSNYANGTLVGIDVSYYQKDIDWTTVKNSGINYAMLRVSRSYYSDSYHHLTDKRFNEYASNANKAGMPIGAYIYSQARNVSDAVSDARYVVSELKGYTISYPVAIDLEDSSQTDLSKAQLGAIAKAFCDEIRRYGYTPMVYCNENWYKNYIDVSQIAGEELWIARYNSHYDTNIKRGIWQCSSTTRIPGISGNVDLDFAYKNYENPITSVIGYWSLYGNDWYFIDANGQYVTGWQFINGNWYYFAGNTVMTTGWQYVNGNWYYMDASGAMKTGWQYINGCWYYMDVNGIMTTGWQYINNHWYYMDANGAMTMGWQYINGYWYYMDANGAMTTGWQYINDQWYYMDVNGIMTTGWQYIGGQWYYIALSGVMTTGWQYINGNWYLMNENGVMTTGWQYISNFWYYMNGNGVMQTGWQFINGTWYYFNASGDWVDSSSMNSYAQGYSSSTKYLIMVDRKACVVGIYYGSRGNWTQQYAWPCALGKAATPTVGGEFNVGGKGYYFDSGNSRCYYYTQFKGNYLFHSVLYNKNGTLQDGRVGIPLSHGCVRLEIGNAKWIYDNIPSGTHVVVY